MIESARWVVADRTESTLVNQLLVNRSVHDPDRFFHPDFERDSHDPSLLPDMAVSLVRIFEAIRTGEPIGVYADYDADGIPGGTLLVRVLRANGARVVPYIPDREREGYGLNEPALRSLRDRGVRLVITVDLGITNSAQVAVARSIGMEVVVTDHHHIDPDRIPTEALGRIHPALPGAKYPFGSLAGGGVAWKLAQAIVAVTGKPSPAELKWLIDLPAISTVCDMVPLTDENRMIVTFGLRVLRSTRNVGLGALYQAADIDPTQITERTVGFQIGPRINAPGRVDHGNGALELLLADDVSAARKLAAVIEDQNRHRQRVLERIVHEASAQVGELGTTLPPALVLAGTDWPLGLIGLAASRVADRFYRPTILLSLGHDGVAKGSGRSIESFNLLAGIHEQRSLLASYGGHERAAGLAMPIEVLTDFRTRFLTYAAATISSEELVPTYRADATLHLREVTTQLVGDLERFAPFGQGNPVPTFVVEPLVVLSVQRLGSERQHIKLRFRDTELTAIGFRFAERFRSLEAGMHVQLLGTIGFNEWNGQRSIQSVMKDLRVVG